MIEKGWPNNLVNVLQILRDFWKVKEDLYVADKLIFKGHCVVVPASKCQLVLKAIREGYQGIEKCKARTRSCVYSHRTISEEVSSL